MTPSPGEKIVVQIYNEIKFAYFVKCSTYGSTRFLIRGKKPGTDVCSTNGWVVDNSLIKNINSPFLLGKRAKNWLDTSEPPKFTDDPNDKDKDKINQKNKDKVKMYVYNKDDVDMYDQNRQLLCNGSSPLLCIRDGINVRNKIGEIVDKKNIDGKTLLYIEGKPAYNNTNTYIEVNDKLIKSNDAVGNDLFFDSDGRKRPEYKETLIKDAECSENKMSIIVNQA